MGLFKNEVGRPSNEIIRKRRILGLIIAVVLIVVVGGGILYIKNSFGDVSGIGKNIKGIRGSGDVASDVKTTYWDGKITDIDSEYILKYAVGMGNPTAAQKKRADVDGDGKVASADARIVSRMSLDGKAPYGDINKDGKHTQEDVDLIVAFSMGNKTPTEEQKKLADVDGDGKITSTNSKKGVTSTTDAMIVYNLVHNGYGDVVTDVDYTKGDGRVTKTDAETILNISVGNITPTELQKKNADINGDGVISAEDARLTLQKANTKVNITQKVTVKFDKNGASSISQTSETCKISTEKGKQSCEVTLPTISGTSVQGWSTNKNGTGTITKQKQKVKVTKNTTYYAITKKVLTATFYKNTAKAITSVYQSCYTTGNSCTVTTSVITPQDGYVAAGWNTNQKATSATIKQNQPITIKGGEKYYAITTKSNSTVLYETKAENILGHVKEYWTYMGITEQEMNKAMSSRTSTDGTVTKKFVHFSTAGTVKKTMRIDVDLTSSASKKYINTSNKVIKIEKVNGANDYRVKLDYLYSKGNYQAHLNDTIQIYVKTKEDNGKVYGPYGVDDYKFKGNYIVVDKNEDPTNNLYFNYEIISEKLDIPYGKTISRIIIEPYNNVNEGRTFALSAISLVRYNQIGKTYSGYTKLNTLYESNFDQNKTRQKIVNSMYDLASVKWQLPSSTPNAYGNISFATKDHALHFKKGETYYGIPYGGGNMSSIEKFTSKLEVSNGIPYYKGEIQPATLSNDKKTYTERRKYWLANANLRSLSISCSTSVGTAIGSNIPLNMSLYDPKQWIIANYDIDYIGDLKVKVNNKAYSLNDYIHYKDKDAVTVSDNSRSNTKYLVSKLSEQDLYKAYASVKPGDVTSMAAIDADHLSEHHVRLVTGKIAHVVCKDGTVLYETNSDGYGLKNPNGCDYNNRGGIDPNKSYLILTDITSSIKSAKNNENVLLNNRRLCNVKGNDSKCISGYLDSKGNLTLKALDKIEAYKQSGLSHLFGLMINDKTLVADWTEKTSYTDLKSLNDFSIYDENDKSNPYKSVIGNWAINHIHTFSALKETGYLPATMKQYSKTKVKDPYAYIINPNSSITDIKNNGLSGTIHSNNEIKKIIYQINGGKEEFTEYVEFNLIESIEKNIYSFYWRKNEKLRELLKTAYKNTVFYDDVVYKGDNTTVKNQIKNKTFSLNNYLKNYKGEITQFRIQVVSGEKTTIVLNLYK